MVRGCMPLRVKFYGILRDAVGSAAVTFPVQDGETVGAVLKRVTDRFPQIRRRIFTPDGGLQPDLLIAVGGTDIRHAGDLKATVRQHEDLLLFPPGAGG